MTRKAVFHDSGAFDDGAPIAVFPGAVSSVFGRTGAVVAVAGDYFGAMPAALTGATQAARFVGATTSGAPASGTFAVGDVVVARDGHVFVCTVAGSPGTWVDVGGTGGGAVSSVSAADTSVVVTPTTGAVTVRANTLDVVAAQHPAAADWSNNSHKITSLANGSSAQDAAAFGQIPTVFPAIVATTIAGLGTPANGDVGWLRLGSSPYEFVKVIYDGTYGKWVTELLASFVIQLSSSYTTTSTSFTSTSEAQARRAYILNYKDMYAAGLRLQMNNECFISNSGANTSTCAISGAEFNTTDTGLTNFASPVSAPWASVANTVAAGKYLVSGWVDADTGTPAKQNAVFFAQVKVSAGTGTFSGPNASFRMVG